MGIKSKIKKILKPSKVTYCPITTIDQSTILKDKNIIVTGGSSGIGKSIAVSACKYGASVLAVGRNEDLLNKTVIAAGDKCKYLVLDLDKKIDSKLINECECLLDGKITTLVNNAGIYVNYNSLNYSYSDFDRIFSTNVRAPFFLSQLYVNYCLENRIKGNIVFTTSNRSLMGDDGPYGMSKASINNFIEGLAREQIKNEIRVNGVAPGMVASNINGIDTKGNMYNSYSKGERVLLPDEIAEIVCFLMSDVSKCITGAIIPCDEGDRLR